MGGLKKHIKGPHAKGTVVLLHGISRSPRSMFRIEKHLLERGYEVHNLPYLWRHERIETIAKGLAEGPLSELGREREELHFVVHSMGGLILRYMQQFFKSFPMGRAVMLGTPNHGSQLADHFRGEWWYKTWFGPAGQQLGTTAHAMAQQLGELNFHAGVIAGDRGLSLASRWLPEPHDGRVSVESTRVEGMKDHLVLPVGHFDMLYRKSVLQAIDHFLECGWFQKTHL